MGADLPSDRCGMPSNVEGETHHAKSRRGSKDEVKEVVERGTEEEEDAARTRRQG